MIGTKAAQASAATSTPARLLPDPRLEPRRRVTVVVPTLNSARTIDACLRSLRAQSLRCDIVVVDGGSTDGTTSIAASLADHLIISAPSRTGQRNLGATVWPAQVVGFVDSDMVLDSGVVEEATTLVERGSGSVVVPEESTDASFWARVRAFERGSYARLGGPEAARFFAWDVFAELNGYDEALSSMEDTDLALRASRLAGVARTASGIVHDEGELTFVGACAKKANYATGIAAFQKKHGAKAMRAHLDRPYLRHPQMLLRRPLLGLGLVGLKAGETLAVLGVLLSQAVIQHLDRAASPLQRLGRQSAARARLLSRLVAKVENWPEVVVRCLGARFGVGERESEIRLRDGLVVRAPAHPDGLWPVIEVFVLDVYRLGGLKEALRSAPVTVVDVGAHLGATSLALNRIFPQSRSVCIEPSPVSAGLLRKNLARNGLTNAEVIEAAAGGHVGWATLDAPSPGSCCTTVREVSDRVAEVPVIAFADVLADCGEGPTIVKLDCEGSEYEILAATPSEYWSNVEAVLLEYHPVEGNGGFVELCARFGEAGLRPCWSEPDPTRRGLGQACFVRERRG